MRPVVDRLKSAYAGRVTIRVLKPGDNDEQRLSALYGIQYVPTFVFVDSNGTQKGDMIIGGASESTLRARLDALR